MFDLGGEKKSKENFIFELERELSTLEKHKEIKKHVEKRIQEIKKVLREGEGKTDFERFGLILHGYLSLLKVMSRFEPK